jgi:ribosomal protein S18 acetylase RimI-like enzyme
MTKKILTIIVFILLIIFYFVYSYFNNEISFKTSEHIKNLNNYQAIKNLHEQCFAPTRRINLVNYHMQQQQISGSIAQHTIEKQIDSFLKELDDSFKHTTNITVMSQGNKIIGLYSCSSDNDRFFGDDSLIWNVCLQKEHQGLGKGQKLVWHAINRCKQNHDHLLLTVDKENIRAQNIYKKLGFKQTDWPQGKPEGFEFFNKILMKYIKK